MKKEIKYSVKNSWSTKFQDYTENALRLDYSFLGREGRPLNNIKEIIKVLESEGYEIIIK